MPYADENKMPRYDSEIQKPRENHDYCIDEAKRTGKGQVRTDAYAEGEGYLGVDDLDRLRRRKIR